MSINSCFWMNPSLGDRLERGGLPSAPFLMDNGNNIDERERS